MLRCAGYNPLSRKRLGDCGYGGTIQKLVRCPVIRTRIIFTVRSKDMSHLMKQSEPENVFPLLPISQGNDGVAVVLKGSTRDVRTGNRRLRKKDDTDALEHAPDSRHKR